MKKTKELVRKGVLLGVGTAAFAIEKASEIVEQVVKEHKISSKEGKKLVTQVLGQAKHLQKTVTKPAVLKAGTKSISQLRRGLQLLDKSLAKLEKNLSKLGKK